MSQSRGDWDAQIRGAWDVSPFAVELSALSEEELPGLERYLTDAQSLPFHYISIHGPSKGREMDEERLVAALVNLAQLAHGIVMHPDTIEDFAPYRELGSKLLIENMDARKQYGRTQTELSEVFDELPEAGFCFDVPHAWSIDREMDVAEELLDAFGSRLRHVHLSSLSDDLHHIPLRVEDEALFTRTLSRCLDVPWIFEAPPDLP